MGKAFNPNKSAQQPLEAVDFFNNLSTINNPLNKSTIQETVRNAGQFDVSAFEDRSTWGRLHPGQASIYDNPRALQQGAVNYQSFIQQVHRGSQQFVANLVSALGQGVANTLDVSGWGNEDYSSSLFGLDTKEMQDWATGVAQRNKILEQEPGEFNPTDSGWLMNQFASSGTGVGMALFALAETAAIEGLTGGIGTAGAIAKLGKLFKNIKNTGGASALITAGEHAKGLKSAATIYGVMNRANESRMEAMQSYNDIEQSLRAELNPDGTPKYTEEEIKEAASAGADRTFWGNVALMPLDILGYRAMVYNPLSGSATGFLERGFSKIGNNALRKATQGISFAGLEGLEEGFQYVVSEEGKHYAKVLSGMEDASTFGERVAQTVQSDEFWNNFAGGVLGSAIIGGAMKGVNKIIGNNKTKQLEGIHDNYLKNVSKVDNYFMNQIKEAEQNGFTNTAAVLRRQHAQHMALKGIHLDAMTDRDTGFDSYMTFLEGTLDELKNGKEDAVNDLGITIQDDEHRNRLIQDFTQYIDDAQTMKKIYDGIKDKYARNVIPEVTYEYFKIDRNQQQLADIENQLAEARGQLFQYNQLSSLGKEIYETEYTLQGLQSEKESLTDELSNIENSFEKSNVQSILDKVDQKLTDTQNRLEEINNDKTYDEDTKSRDNAILNASVIDKEYLRLNALKQRLTHQIDMQIRNLKNWTDKNYLIERQKEVIKKAKTKQQVDEAVANIQAQNKDNKVTTQIQQAAQERKTKIDAEEQLQEAHGEMVKQNSNPPFEEDESKENHIPGNADLFGKALDRMADTLDDSKKRLDDMTAKLKALNKTKEIKDEYGVFEEGETNETPEYLFSPAVIDESKFDEEKKNKIRSAIAAMLGELGTNPTFESLVRAAIQARGKEFADKNYNLFIAGWRLNNMKEEPFMDIYKKVFTDPFELVEQVGEQVFTTEYQQEQQQFSEKNEQTAEKVIEQLGPKKFDQENQTSTEKNKAKLNIEHTGVVTNNNRPKMAKSIRLATQVIEDNKSTWHYIANDMNEGEDVNSLPLLNFEKYKAGTQVEARVPDNYLDIQVPLWGLNGKKQYMSFGAYVQQNNLKPEDQQYQDKIPIIIYNKGQKEGKGLAFVHDIDWYNEFNFDPDSETEMREAIAATRKVRQSVLSNNNKALLTITENRPTTFAPFRTPVTIENGQNRYQFIPFSEANPGAIFAVATSADEVSYNNKDAVLNDDNNQILHNKPLIPGYVYDVRLAGIKNGKQSWNLFEVAPPPITAEVKTTITSAIAIYLTGPARLSPRQKEVVKQIKDITGLDLTNQADVQFYIRQFVNIPKLDDADTNEKGELQIRRQFEKRANLGARNTYRGYLAFLKGGNVIVGIDGQNAFVSNGKGMQSLWGNPNKKGEVDVKAIKYLYKKSIKDASGKMISILDTFKQNYEVNAAIQNKPVVLIVNGEVKQAANSYKEFIMSQYNTNMRAINVGTEQKPMWVSSDNMITYELSTDEGNNVEKESTLQEITATIITPQEGNEEVKKEQSTDTSNLEAEIKEQIKKDLGIDLNNLPNFDDFAASARVLTNEERQQLGSLDERIPGLNPKEEDELVDFFVTQIFQRVQLKFNAIPESEVRSQVTEILKEVLIPIKNHYKERQEHYENLLKEHPHLADAGIPVGIQEYKNRINKILLVESNIDLLYRKAKNIAVIHTGQVKENKIKTEEFEDNQLEQNDNSIGEAGGEQEIDFYTDVLTLNPDNKISYNIRRFLRGIPKVDINGNPILGVFNIPTYENADDMVQVLMTKLANVPADFDSMIQKLEEQENYPWIKSVVDKLKAASQSTKNQFVTAMANAPLRLKFTMITQNRKNGTWSTKIWDTNEGGLAQMIRSEWKNNFYNTDLVLRVTDEEGDAQLNKEKAKELLSTYEGWLGTNLKVVQSVLPQDIIRQANKVRKGESQVITPTGDLFNELEENIKRSADRMRLQIGTTWYQVKKAPDGKYIVGFLDSNIQATEAEIKKWLAGFGITPVDKTIKELVSKGLYHNNQQTSFKQLFQPKVGLFGILYDSLADLVAKQGEHYFKTEGKLPVEETVVKSLAQLDAKFDTTHVPHGGRDGGKSFYAITANKFITDRTKELKHQDEQLRDQLRSLSFSKHSLWLRLMSDNNFRNKFDIAHASFNMLKIRGKNTRRDNGITKLSDQDYEVATAGAFWDMTQGTVKFEDKITYPNTTIPMRWGTMLAPTMSDKHIAILIQTAVLNLQNKHLNSGDSISDEVVDVLYSQIIKPELERMITFHQQVKKTNIKAYDKGAGLFLLLPKLNDITVGDSKLIDLIAATPESYTVENIEADKDVMTKFRQTIKDTIETLKNEKLQIWRINDIASLDDKGNIASTFIDNDYLNSPDKFVGTGQQKLNMAAYDLVINQMISLANSYMLYVGDPALYYKKDSNTNSKDYIQVAKDTFVNIGKRLANQIAPGTTIANSQNENYIQLFIQDRNAIADRDFIKYSTKILDGESITDEEIDFVMDYHANENPTLEQENKYKKIKTKYSKSAGFLEIESADAQEYTTWQEHLSILERLGRTPDVISDITAEQIQAARDLFSSGKSKKEMTEAELELIALVMQPIKPVYTGQHYDGEQDVMRVVYVKSSSFPLIPQLTEGMEIDKLRQKMEEIQSRRNMKVRASYQTANKVGAMNNAPNIWDRDGRASEEGLDFLEGTAMVMQRKYFRIQQEVPFKSGKITTKEDKQTYGTQLMKLLFGNDIMSFSGFSYAGKTLSGVELQQIYNQLHINLVNSKKKQLYEELGLDDTGKIVNAQKSFAKLYGLLKREAEERNFPLQTIEGLKFIGQGDNKTFTLPLWASVNSNKFEALLNAIIVNRLVRIKFPGNSYIVGSEEGFKMQEDFTGVDQSRIVFTESWTGELKATYHANGKIKKAQVLVGSKFRNKKGELIDLFEGFNGQDGKYIKKSETGTILLKKEMFDESLLRLTTFRIPTTGISSASEVEIVGFLPHQNADLMIVPRNFTKQKGLDFDVDKENSYHYWHYPTDSGKFEKLSRKHKAEIIAKLDDRLKDANPVKYEGTEKTSFTEPGARIFNQVFNDLAKEMGWEEYTEEELAYDSMMQKVNRQLDDKIIQNEILEVYESVLSNPDEKLQAKINNVLNTTYTEQEADFIESLTPSTNIHWTPLSGEYQKQKLQLGSQGKVGTGAYALDITFHSLVQQAKALGTPLRLIRSNREDLYTDSGTPVNMWKNTEVVKWRFGKLDKGGIESTGVLGESVTLDGGRTTSDVLNEKGQTAVDNEKLQIMGKVNINGYTLDVDKMFNLLGFDKFKTKEGHSVSYLFMSQPILREYVQMLGNASSNLNTSFEANKEQKVVDKLLKKYYPEIETLEITPDILEKFANMMGESELIEAIQSQDPVTTHGEMQAGILLRFLEMKQYGLAIRNIQTSLNIDSKGLDKSFFNVIQKRQKIDNIGKGIFIKENGQTVGEIMNVKALVGDYVEKPVSDIDVDNFLQQGYYDTGNFLVKPTTLSGGFNVAAVATAYHLWRKHMPFDGPVMNVLYEEILPLITTETSSDMRQIELKQEVFAEFKKYLATAQAAGFVQDNEDIKAERERLYIDSENNTSLATYLSEIMKITGNPVIDTFIKSNKLFNRLTFELSKTGGPSLIKYNNAKGESFDESFLYNALTQLMEVVGKTGKYALPKIGNKEYTLDTLAQDLITYAMIGNAKQEAIQFTKYIPVNYLNVIGYSAFMRDMHYKLNLNGAAMSEFGAIQKVPGKEHVVTPFTTQFIQHNPEFVRAKYNKEDFKRLFKKQSDGSFILEQEDKPTFVSVYDHTVKDSKKFRLYKYNGETYDQIPILGTFGMDEYKWNQQVGQSSVNGKYRAKETVTAIQEIPEEVENNPFNILSSTAYQVVESIGNSNSRFAELAKNLLPYVGNVTLSVEEFAEDDHSYGKYFEDNNSILINTKYLKDAERIADTVMHELVHALTVKQIKPHIVNINADVLEVKPNAPEYVSDLVLLYNRARKSTNPALITSVQLAIAQRKGLTQEERDKGYGVLNIKEFIAMAMTDKPFQEVLSKMPYEKSGKTYLQKLKEIVTKVLTSLGLEVKPNSPLAVAIDRIFELIEKENTKTEIDPYGVFTADDFENPPEWFDEDNQAPPEINLSLSASQREGLIFEALKYVDKVPDMYQEYIRSNPEEALKQIAMQAHDSPSAAMETRATFGKDIVDIAQRLFPDAKNPSTLAADDFIKNLEDNNLKNCD